MFDKSTKIIIASYLVGYAIRNGGEGAVTYIKLGLTYTRDWIRRTKVWTRGLQVVNISTDCISATDTHMGVFSYIMDILNRV